MTSYIIAKILLISKSGILNINWYILTKVLLCNTVFCLAWPGVNLEAEQLSPLLDFQKILVIAETIA